MFRRIILNKYFPIRSFRDISGEQFTVKNLGKLNHIAIATADLEGSMKFYREVLGADVSDPVAQPNHGVYTVFVTVENTKIELLKPLGDKSPIQKFLDKNKDGGLHHVCLEVTDLAAAMKKLKENNIRWLGEKPKIGAHGFPVLFLHPKDCGGVLIELEECG